jgi:photosystem II stability/assembly factor-like uncharacterized protein
LGAGVPDTQLTLFRVPWRLWVLTLLFPFSLVACGGASALSAGNGSKAANHSNETTTTSPASVSVPAGFLPSSFSAVSSTQWWVLGSTPCGTQDCPALVTTVDGGITFQSLPAPDGPFGPRLNMPPEATNIRFADPQDGWAFDPGLYATHDGGRLWEAISMDGIVTELEPGADQVFAVVEPATPPCSSTGTCTSDTPEPQLWRASPSSDDWTLDSAAGGVSGGLAVHGTSVWVVNSLSTPDGPALGSGLLQSNDDGSHFLLESQPIPGIACDYSPVSDTDVWSYCSGGHFMYAYQSSDAGERFTPIIPSQASQVSPNSFPNGSTLVAASAGIAVAASGSLGSPLIRTVDGGTMWSVVQGPPDKTGSWALIGFTTSDVGYAFWEYEGISYPTSTAQLWRTTDAGATWSPVTTLP